VDGGHSRLSFGVLGFVRFSVPAAGFGTVFPKKEMIFERFDLKGE